MVRTIIIQTRRDRKLLLNKKELEKIQRGNERPRFYYRSCAFVYQRKGLAKLVVALAKGKNSTINGNQLKEKDDRRDMARMFKR